ncbi:UNVERIFIED_CONTAM: hypothetical protein Sradi_4008200 [Sesamum radiatum]|uniref:Uncharacterized protein n=1 Tax=Sesamum radiatum TaxID=300843 RepID=A0AAW2PKM8_SESRA
MEVRFCIPRVAWNRLIDWANKRWRSRHPVNTVHKALLASLVYHIRMERNRHIFTTDRRTAKHTAQLCIAQLRSRIIGAFILRGESLSRTSEGTSRSQWEATVWSLEERVERMQGEIDDLKAAKKEAGARC